MATRPDETADASACLRCGSTAFGHMCEVGDVAIVRLGKWLGEDCGAARRTVELVGEPGDFGAIAVETYPDGVRNELSDGAGSTFREAFMELAGALD